MGARDARWVLAAALLGCAATSDALDAAVPADAAHLIDAAGSSADAAEACSGLRGGDSAPPVDGGLVIARDEDCEGADLYVVSLSTCSSCGGSSAMLIVANRGTAASSYRIASNAQTLDVEVPLRPQAASDAHGIELQPTSSTVRVIAAGDDCDPSNNDREVVVPFITCE